VSCIGWKKSKAEVFYWRLSLTVVNSAVLVAPEEPLRVPRAGSSRHRHGFLLGSIPQPPSTGGSGTGHRSALLSCKPKRTQSFTAWQKGHGWEERRACLQFCSHPRTRRTPRFVLLE